MEEYEFKLEDRVLCSDEACIGLVGTDGKCKECGLRYDGADPLPGTPSDDLSKPAAESESSEDDSTPESCPDTGCDPDERVCCIDESCIGIIGAGGKCGTCGKPA